MQIVASAGGELQASTVIQAAEECPKPVLFLWTGSIKDTSSLPKLQASDVPVFYLPGRIAKGVRRLLDYYRTRQMVLAESALLPERPSSNSRVCYRALAPADGRWSDPNRARVEAGSGPVRDPGDSRGALQQRGGGSASG